MSTASKPLETQRRRSSDPVSWYLATIGRIPLLTPAEEIELGNQVQAMMALTEDGSREFEDGELTTPQRRLLRIGRRAKERMMKANLRLVVSVAKKYQGKGLELLDLIQEGSTILVGVHTAFFLGSGMSLGLISSTPSIYFHPAFTQYDLLPFQTNFVFLFTSIDTVMDSDASI